MEALSANKWIITKYFGKENFEQVKETLDAELGAGDVLVKAEYLSVDPYMRIDGLVGQLYKYTGKTDAVIGTQVGLVIKSCSDKFPTGSYVYGELGWRTSTVCNESKVNLLPEMGGLPKSAILGVMGMPGMTAYFGVCDILHPKPGEVCLVSSAAGAVGCIAGQILKLKGCKVIGSAGSQRKVDMLLNEFGFDVAFNYKTEHLEDILAKHAPDGIDCFFDNVGVDFTASVIPRMNTCGRIAACGSISTYKYPEDKQPSGPHPYYFVVTRRLRIQGFFGWGEIQRWPEAQAEMLQWIREGKVKHHEHVTNGFQNMPTAFLELFDGACTGKPVVKV